MKSHLGALARALAARGADLLSVDAGTQVCGGLENHSARLEKKWFCLSFRVVDDPPGNKRISWFVSFNR